MDLRQPQTVAEEAEVLEGALVAFPALQRYCRDIVAELTSTHRLVCERVGEVVTALGINPPGEDAVAHWGEVVEAIGAMRADLAAAREENERLKEQARARRAVIEKLTAERDAGGWTAAQEALRDLVEWLSDDPPVDASDYWGTEIEKAEWALAKVRQKHPAALRASGGDQSGAGHRTMPSAEWVARKAAEEEGRCVEAGRMLGGDQGGGDRG